MLDPGSCVQHIQDPGLRVLYPGSRIQHPGSRILDFVSRILGPGSCMQEAGLCWTQNPISRILVEGSRFSIFVNLFVAVFGWACYNISIHVSALL